MLTLALGPWLYVLSLLVDNGFGLWPNAGNRFLYKEPVTTDCPCLGERCDGHPVSDRLSISPQGRWLLDGSGIKVLMTAFMKISVN